MRSPLMRSPLGDASGIEVPSYAKNGDRMPRQKLLDISSYLTIAITLVLFVVALFVKGLTHDILLEAGVFLVSAKLVLMTYKNSASSEAILRELEQLRKLLGDRDGRSA